MISGVRRLRKRTVVVHLLSGQSMRGVLRGVYADAIALSHVHHLDENVDLSGELVIPRDRIDFYQLEAR